MRGGASPGTHLPDKPIGTKDDGFAAKFTAAGVRMGGTEYSGAEFDIVSAVTPNALGELYIGGFRRAATSSAPRPRSCDPSPRVCPQSTAAQRRGLATTHRGQNASTASR